MHIAQKQRLTMAGLVLAGVLLAVKGWAAFATGSPSVPSDAINSLLDLGAYAFLFLSVRLHDKHPDEDHHFGHRRAEPLASIFLGMLAIILGLVVLRQAIFPAAGPEEVAGSAARRLGYVALGLSVFGKALLGTLYAVANRREPSAALRAASLDSRNDVVTSLAALVGLSAGGTVDRLVGLVIGAWIIISGASLGWQNVGYLMGKAPDETILDSVRQVAMAVPGVVGLNDVRAHYVGDVLHVEIHVEVDQAISVTEAHDIGLAVKRRLEEDPLLHRVFVHIDPV